MCWNIPAEISYEESNLLSMLTQIFNQVLIRLMIIWLTVSVAVDGVVWHGPGKWFVFSYIFIIFAFYRKDLC